MWNGLMRKLQVGLLAAVVSVAAMADVWHESGSPILRSQKDPSRERGWMLTPRGVAVFDYKARKTIAFVELPEWIWAGEEFACPPELALGPKGEALVTSNVVPSVWRIDPASLRVTKHDLVIDAHLDKDVGFTGLAYAAELGAFLAVSDFGALWRIDPLLRRAQHIALNQPVPLACGLAPFARSTRQRARRLFAVCIQGERENWNVSIAPDQRSGYVRPSCSD